MAREKLHILAVIDGILTLFNCTDKKIIFKGVMANDSKLIPARVVRIYNEEKFIMSDANGVLWTCTMPFDQIFAHYITQHQNQAAPTILNPNQLNYVYGR